MELQRILDLGGVIVQDRIQPSVRGSKSLQCSIMGDGSIVFSIEECVADQHYLPQKECQWLSTRFAAGSMGITLKSYWSPWIGMDWSRVL